MRTSPLLADFIHARACKSICEKYLTRPVVQPAMNLLKVIDIEDAVSVLRLTNNRK